MTNQNEQFKAVTDFLEGRGVAKEELLLATHAVAFALLSNATFASVLPEELRIFNVVADGDSAAKRVVSEPAITLAVIHAAASYVQCHMQGRAYDSKTILDSFNKFPTLNAEQQRSVLEETLRFADMVITDMCSHLEPEKTAEFMKGNEDAFELMVAELKGKHQNILLEAFQQMTILLAGVVQMSVKAIESGSSFNDALEVHRKIGFITGMKLQDAAERALSPLIEFYLKGNLSAEDYEVADAMVMMAVGGQVAH